MQKTATGSRQFNTASVSFDHISQERCDSGLQSPRPSSVKHDTVFFSFSFVLVFSYLDQCEVCFLEQGGVFCLDICQHNNYTLV